MDNIEEIIKYIIEFVIFFEKYGNETIINANKLWHDIIKTREEIIFSLNIMILYYKDILNFKIDRSLQLFQVDEHIQATALNNTIENINNKIQIIIQTIENAKLNANSNLLIDKMIIDLGRGNKDG